MKLKLNILKKDLALCCLIIPLCSAAQTIINNNVIPPSPQAQDLVQYGKVPVSLYTGIPDISVPIYTIKLKDLSIPITLDYNASGIKVEQEAGTVGLGWVLRTGGIITHTIRGYNDDESCYYFNEGTDNMKDLVHAYSLNGSTIGLYSQPFPINFADGMEKLEFYRRLGNTETDFGAIDFSPDLYNYSFGSYSGSFIFKHNGEIAKEKTDNVKIEPQYTLVDGSWTLTSFILTTPEGTRYDFTQLEKAYDESIAARYGKNHISGYYLTRIVTINQTEVQFIYKNLGSTRNIYSRVQNDDYSGGQINIHNASYDNICLASITYPGGTVIFNYSQNRTDLYNALELNSIQVRGSNSVNFTWNFNYSYFAANNIKNEIPNINYLKNSVGSTYYNETWDKQRLRLDGVDQVAGTQILSYKFSYNETNLPTKLSVAQDHWGYFNNADNTSLIPRIFHNDSFDKNTYNVKAYGLYADREPNGGYNQCYLLNKITYPTGGYDLFTFEPQRYSTDCFEGDPYRKDYLYGKTTQSIREKDYEMLKGNDRAVVDVPTLDENPTYRSTANPYISLKLVLNDNYFRTYYSKYGSVHFKLYNSQNSVVWSYDFPDSSSPVEDTSANRVYEKSWSNVVIAKGTYTMEVTGSARRDFLDSLQFMVSVVSPPSEYISRHPCCLGGGVRIKEINSYNTNGDRLYGKRYYYTINASKDSTQSSGKLMSYPRYVIYDSNKGRLKAISNGIRDNGASVGYSEVSIFDKDKDNKEIARTTYKFINKPDSNLYYFFDNTSFNSPNVLSGKDLNPIGIEPLKHTENGTLLEESKYLLTSSGASCLESTDYEYKAIEGMPDIYWGVVRDFDTSWSVCWSDNTWLELFNSPQSPLNTKNSGASYPVGYFYPALRPYNLYLSDQTEKTYRDGYAVTKTSGYTYNIYHQLSGQKLTVDGDTDIISYKYPRDYYDNDSICKLLADANVLNLPIKVSRDRNGKVLITDFKYSLFDHFPRLSSLLTNTGTNGATETRSTVRRYDSHGNIVEVLNEDNIPTVYLWGYNFQYPIAEIKNATFAQVSSAYGLDVEKQGSTNTGITLDRTKLPKALITTFIYDPGIGVMSVTSPDNTTRTYRYDNLGRLMNILDEDGKVVETYQYNYKK